MLYYLQLNCQTQRLFVYYLASPSPTAHRNLIPRGHTLWTIAVLLR